MMPLFCIKCIVEDMGKQNIHSMSNVYSRKKFQGGIQLVGVDLGVHEASTSHQGVGFVDVERLNVDGGSSMGFVGGLEGVDLWVLLGE